MSNAREEDLEEADQLTAAAEKLTGATRDEVLAEAAQLRAKWHAPKEMVALAGVSAHLREADLAEAARLLDVATALRPGSAGRNAVEAEAAALLAKWPDFEDDEHGQIQRLGAYLLSRGLAKDGAIPARVVLDRIAELEAQLSGTDTSTSCHGCGLPRRNAGPTPVNSSLFGAIKYFETDRAFRDQVIGGQVKPGQSSTPWIPGSPPHPGPQTISSPLTLAWLAVAIANDPLALAAVGPRLREAFRDHRLSVPEAPRPAAAPPPRLNGHAPH